MRIDELKKNDRFVFNDEVYTVTRKYIDDDKPMIAIKEPSNERHLFHWEGLESVKVTSTQP
jgi:hypothetical protein